MKSKFTQLARISKSFYKENKELIEDIILFGSTLRGKEEPSDIDILIIFAKKADKDVEYEFKKQISKVFENISLISKTEKQLHDPSFVARESILFEGYSLIREEFIASDFGFSSLGIFIYHTKKLDNVSKTRFYYALNGRRGSKGVADMLDAIKLSDNIIAFPLSKVEDAKEFFEEWKIDYTYVPSLMPLRLAKKTIIGKVR